MSVPAEIQTVEKILNANDRCDQCGSQAYFAAILDAGELYFCRHHYLKNENALREVATDIIDQSAELHHRQETGAYPDSLDQS